jgi:hypothetical protein
MYLIGVDYHPSFQTMAFFVEETGEYGEQELNHSDGVHPNENPSQSLVSSRIDCLYFLPGLHSQVLSGLTRICRWGQTIRTPGLPDVVFSNVVPRRLRGQD